VEIKLTTTHCAAHREYSVRGLTSVLIQHFAQSLLTVEIQLERKSQRKRKKLDQEKS